MLRFYFVLYFYFLGFMTKDINIDITKNTFFFLVVIRSFFSKNCFVWGWIVPIQFYLTPKESSLTVFSLKIIIRTQSFEIFLIFIISEPLNSYNRSDLKNQFSDKIFSPNKIENSKWKKFSEKKNSREKCFVGKIKFLRLNLE